MPLRLKPDTPVVTYTLMVLCLLVPPLSMTWLPGVEALLGRLVYAPVLTAAQPYRMLTTAFVHGSYIHLALNMVALYVAGRPVEQALGRVRYLALYLLSALAGSVAVLLWAAWVDPYSAAGSTVGASGAIFGLFIAVFMIQRHVGIDSTGLLILIALNLGAGFVMAGISWQAHLGGLIAGAALAGGFTWAARQERGRRAAAFQRGGAALAQAAGQRWRTGACAGVIALVLFIEVALSALAVHGFAWGQALGTMGNAII